MRDPVIRLLAIEDLDDAFALSATSGWNQRLDDWRMLLRLAPAGAFAALSDARIVGTAIGIDYTGFAWIAMMLVDPAYRGRGVGRRLLEAAMSVVPSHCPIRLDATPLGRPLYQRYGFEDEAMLSRHVADVSSSRLAFASEALDGSAGVRPLTTADLDIVIERDSETFGGNRGAVLEWALQGAPQYAHIVQNDGGLTHYCLGRRGRLFDQIGPVVAGREDIAQALVRAAGSAADDRPVAVDAFDSRTGFTAWLGTHGFHIQRPLFRMCRPAESGAEATGPLRRCPMAEFAILGPEFA
jgi:GNAT superfamily N-acetyltransferase